MNDIEYNKDVIKNGNFEKWCPIGTKEYNYNGIFEGNGMKITGLYVDDKSDYQGLLGCIGENGIVNNIEVSDSYINGKCIVGGIAGENFGKISNCFTDNNIIIGENQVGGNVGFNLGKIEGECNNSGEVREIKEVGGNVGFNQGNTAKVMFRHTGAVIGTPF